MDLHKQQICGESDFCHLVSSKTDHRRFAIFLFDEYPKPAELVIMSERRYGNCFVCGQDNPAGLKLHFEADEQQAWAFFDSPAIYQGYDNIIHGGIIATLLDEAMANILVHKGLIALTADLNIRYRKPLAIGTKVRLSGEITLQKTRTIHTRGVLADEAGQIYAESTGVYIIVKKEV